MRERYEIENVEQLHAIADILRLRIIDLLEKQAMTVTQVGERFGLAPAKVHYHVRELERVGLLELVETREKGGILEKYYQPIAASISVSRTLFSNEPDESQAMFRTLLEQASDGYMRAFSHFGNVPDASVGATMTIDISHLSLTREEQDQVLNQFHEILKPFEQRDTLEGTQEIEFSLLMYPIVPSAVAQPEATPQMQKSWCVGAIMYTRDDLLKVRVAGRRLSINVVGVCRFANNIEASLVDEVIASFKIVGKLLASPEVKDVLKSKEVQDKDVP